MIFISCPAPQVNNYTFWVNVGEERTGPSIHLQGSDPDDVPVAYYLVSIGPCKGLSSPGEPPSVKIEPRQALNPFLRQIWDEDPWWRLSDITFIRLPPVEGYETQVEGRPRGGGEINFAVPSSSNPPTEVRMRV